MRNILVFLLIGFSTTFVSFSQVKNKAFDDMVNKNVKGTIPLLKVSELKAMLDKREVLLLLDTREKNEFEVSHIPGAVYVGYDKFSLSSLEAYSKNQTIVTYCSIGYRSEKVGEKLKKAGYKNVYNLYGGIFDWVNSGYSVEDESKNKTRRVHAYNKNWGIWLYNADKVYE